MVPSFRLTRSLHDMTASEIDFELALLMGFDPRLKNDRCYIGSPEFDQVRHGDRYSPTRNWKDAIPVIEHFKVDILSGDLESSFRLFLFERLLQSGKSSKSRKAAA